MVNRPRGSEAGIPAREAARDEGSLEQPGSDLPILPVVKNLDRRHPDGYLEVGGDHARYGSGPSKRVIRCAD